VTRLPRGLRALAHRDFRIFFAGQALALVGGWVQAVAQSWLVLELTGSPLRLALINSFHFAPVLFGSLFAGAVVDRLPKRRLLVVAATAYALQALILAVLVGTGRVAYWHVVAGALAWGVLITFDTPARMAFVAGIVGRDDVGSAIALNTAAFNAARVVGPAVAGLVVGFAGLTPAFALNALAAASVVVALLAIRSRGLPAAATGRSILDEVAEVLRYAARTPLVLVALALLLVMSLTVFNFALYIPLLARDVLGAGAEAFGFLMAAVGVGAVMGALAVGAGRSHAPAVRSLFAASVVACTGLVGLSLVGRFWTAWVTLFIVGIGSVVAVAGVNTLLQVIAPDALRGRVMSLYSLIFGGAFPIGAFLVGVLAEGWGVRAALAVAGGVGLAVLAAIGVAWRWRPGRRRQASRGDR
jgi:predicted MFS family arabinose efflux permease